LSVHFSLQNSGAIARLGVCDYYYGHTSTELSNIAMSAAKMADVVYAYIFFVIKHSSYTDVASESATVSISESQGG
jgi:hypothetical protein